MTKRTYTNLNKRKKKKYSASVVRDGQALIFIDGMGDSKLLDELAVFAKGSGREDEIFVLDFSPKFKSQSLNPATGEIK